MASFLKQHLRLGTQFAYQCITFWKNKTIHNSVVQKCPQRNYNPHFSLWFLILNASLISVTSASFGNDDNGKPSHIC